MTRKEALILCKKAYDALMSVMEEFEAQGVQFIGDEYFQVNDHCFSYYELRDSDD